MRGSTMNVRNDTATRNHGTEIHQDTMLRQEREWVNLFQVDMFRPDSTNWVTIHSATIQNPSEVSWTYVARSRMASGSAGNSVQSRLVVNGNETVKTSTASNKNIYFTTTISPGATVTVEWQGRDSSRPGKASFKVYDGNQEPQPVTETGPAVWLNRTPAKCTVNSVATDLGIDADIPLIGDIECVHAALGSAALIGTGIILTTTDL